MDGRASPLARGDHDLAREQGLAAPHAWLVEEQRLRRRWTYLPAQGTTLPHEGSPMAASHHSFAARTARLRRSLAVRRWITQ